MSARKPLVVTWLGHATALIELDDTRVLTDPVLRERIGPLRRIATSVNRGVLENLDAVVISHLHADHADVKLRPRRRDDQRRKGDSRCDSNSRCDPDSLATEVPW